MVENVRRRAREGKPDAFSDEERLGDRNVLVVVPRTFQHESTGVAERSQRRRSKATRVEPMADVALIGGKVPVAGTIGQPADCIRIGPITARIRRRKEVPGLHVADPV